VFLVSPGCMGMVGRGMKSKVMIEIRKT
jgi:hypothetical protein